MFLLNPLHPLDDIALGRSATLDGGGNLTAQHHLERRQSDDFSAFLDADRTVRLFENERLHPPVRSAARAPARIARDAAAEAGVDGRPAVADLIRSGLGAGLSFAFGLHRRTCSSIAGGAARSSATASKLSPLAASLACLPVTAANRRRIVSQYCGSNSTTRARRPVFSAA